MPYTAAQLTSFYTAVNQGQAPDAATALQFQAAAQQNASGALSDPQTLALALNSAQTLNTTDVATASYQFFTGGAPSAAGLVFLVNNASSGFNTPYFNSTGTATAPGPGGFNLENRYFNEAVALATSATTGASFRAAYGALTLQQTVAAAYETIIGTANVGSSNAQAAIASITSSLPYFTQVARERAGGVDVGGSAGQNIALKAVIVGYILEEGLKADVGTYARAVDQFNAGIAASNAAYATNILSTYGPGGSAFGTGVGASAVGLGASVPLTAATDAFTQSAANLTYVAAVGGAAPTLTAADVIQASGANATLLVTDAAGVDATGGALLSGIRTVLVRNISGGTSTVNASSVAGVTTLAAYLSTGAVAFTNVAAATNVNIVGNGTLANGAVSAAYVAAATGATVNLVNGVTGGALTVVDGGSGNLTTLTINSTGVANTIGGGTAVGVRTLTVNATSPLTTTANIATTNTLTTLNVAGVAAVNLATLNSSALTTVTSSDTGGLRLTVLNPSGALASLTTSAGADNITITGALSAGATINLGGGGDSLALGAAFADGATLNGGGGATLFTPSAAYTAESAYANLSRVTGFGTLTLTTPLANGGVYDPSLIGAGNVAVTGVATGGTATVNVVSGALVGLTGALATDNGALTLAVGSGPTAATLAANTRDTLNLQYIAQAASATSTVTALGVETVNVGAIAPATGVVTTVSLTDPAATTINLSGPGGLAFAANAAMTRLTLIDASAATGAETISTAAVVSATAAAPLVVRGGAGADTLAFRDFTTLTGGAGADLFTIFVPTSGQTYSSITDAGVGDRLGFAGSTSFGATAITLAATAAFQDYLDAAAGRGVGALSYFVFAGDTYVVEDNSPAANFQNGADAVIRLVGVHDLSTAATSLAGGVLTLGG